MKDIAVPIVAILVIGGLSGMAIYKGIDGLILAGTVGSIAGIAGYEIKKIKDRVIKTHGNRSQHNSKP